MPYTLKRLSALLLASICLVFSPTDSFGSPSDETVIILHGIARSSAHMAPLANYLMHEGYEIINLDYPSTNLPLTALIKNVASQLENVSLNSRSKVHFVGYSMGGLIIRGYLNKYPPKNLGRVLLLGTPNKGSEVADFWKSNYFYQKIFGPAGQELTTDYSNALNEILGEVNYELGIIAGTSTIDPFSSYLLPKPNDGKVSVESTKVKGMSAHIMLPVSHTFFPSNSLVKQQTVMFLKEGHFNPL